MLKAVLIGLLCIAALYLGLLRGRREDKHRPDYIPSPPER